MESFADDGFLDMDWLDEYIAALEADKKEPEERLSRVFKELRGGHKPAGDNDKSRLSQGALNHSGPGPRSMGDGPLQWQSRRGNADREPVKEHERPTDSETISRNGLEPPSVGDSEGPAVSEDTTRDGSNHACAGATGLEGKSSLCTAYEGARRCDCEYSVQSASSDGTSTSSCCNPAMNAASETNVPLITEAKQAGGETHGGILPQTEHTSQTLSQ
ncbi:hypothetical protein MRX96_032420 [Rhipicephalus microplus]